TLLGGMKAVIWNDCLQLVVYMLSGILIAFVIAGRMPDGFDSIASFGKHTERFTVIDFGWDWSNPYTFWAGLFGGIFLSLGTHGVDQMLVQRYLAAKSRSHAATALIASGFVVCMQFAFFLFLGIALAAYYDQPDLAAITAENMPGDEAMATFIVNELPRGIGLVGFILAGVFAAAMSTLSSSLNSSATVVVNDLIGSNRSSNEQMLSQSRIWTAVFGLLQMGIAFAAAGVTRSVVSEVLAIAGMTVGLLLGLFALSRLSPACRQTCAIGGMILAALVLFSIKFLLPNLGITIAWPWFALIGSMSTLVFATLVDWMLPRSINES
ncbi:MAG: transporter, partial [Planctomycetota bacterium]